MVVKRPMVAFLTLIAAGIRNNPATNTTPEQQQSAINYFETWAGG